MNYSDLVKEIKKAIMQIPTKRLLLIWFMFASLLTVWRLADILQAIAALCK